MRKKTGCYIALGMIISALSIISVSGKQVEKEIQVGNFNSVTLECNANLHIKTGAENSLTVITSEKDFSKINASVKDNNLILSVEKQGKNWWEMMGVFVANKDIEFNLTVKNLDNITLTSNGNINLNSDIKTGKFYIISMGSGNIKCGNIETDLFKANTVGSSSIEVKSLSVSKTLEITSSGSGQIHLYDINSAAVDMTASGSSTINIRNIKADNIIVDILGSGTISIQGSVENQDVKVYGTGRYYGGLLKSQEAKVKAFGASNIEVNVEKELSVDVFGSSLVNVDNNPKIKSRNIYGSGNMIMQYGTNVTGRN